MKYKLGAGKEFIPLKEILNHFNLDLNLSPKLLDSKVSSDFKLASFTIENHVYKFKLEDCLMIIDPSNQNKTLTEITYEKYKGNMIRTGSACLGWDGSITRIS